MQSDPETHWCYHANEFHTYTHRHKCDCAKATTHWYNSDGIDPTCESLEPTDG